MCSTRPSGAAIGFSIFAGVMMLTIGIVEAIAGIVALADDSLYAWTRKYTFEFLFIPYWTLGSLLLIALGVAIVWAHCQDSSPRPI